MPVSSLLADLDGRLDVLPAFVTSESVMLKLYGPPTCCNAYLGLVYDMERRSSRVIAVEAAAPEI
jgi:hypothetical protein